MEIRLFIFSCFFFPFVSGSMRHVVPIADAQMEESELDASPFVVPLPADLPTAVAIDPIVQVRGHPELRDTVLADLQALHDRLYAPPPCLLVTIGFLIFSATIIALILEGSTMFYFYFFIIFLNFLLSLVCAFLQ